MLVAKLIIFQLWASSTLYLCFVFILTISLSAVLLGQLPSSSGGSPTERVRPAPAAQITGSARSIALVVSGGVSLGSYQAGFLYFAAEAFKNLPRKNRPLHLATGASAGSANAIIAGIESCLPPQPELTNSLGWKIWIPVGFSDLWQADKSRSDGVLSNDAMQTTFSLVSSQMMAGLSEECDFVVGFTTTRVKPLSVELTPGLRVPRQEEKFVVRIQGRGVGHPAQVTNYISPYEDVPLPILPLSEEHSVQAAKKNYEALGTVLFASASFPMAFSPWVIPHCLTQPLDPQTTEQPKRHRLNCPQPEREDSFIDGGIFDNHPLNLAYETVDLGLRSTPTGELRWRDLEQPRAQDERIPDEILFAYVTPATRAYPSLPERDLTPDADSLSYGLDLVSNFVATSRATELYSLVKQRDRVRDRVVLSRLHFPPAGNLYQWFFGFFERDLRIFDFYLGMYDAYILVKSQVGTWLGPIEKSVPKSWRPFACMLGWFEKDHHHLRRWCQDDELRNFRILLQVSMERLYHHCSKLSPSQLEQGIDHSHCEAAFQGQQPPTIIKENAQVWHKGLDLTSNGGILNRLAELKFEFRDLGLKPSQSNQVRSVLRSQFLDISNRVSELDSNRSIRLQLSTIGRVLSNELGYEPPPISVPVMLGTDIIESGILWTPFRTTRKWLRLSATLQLRNWSSFLPRDTAYLAIAGAIGPEVFIPGLTSGIVQSSIGFRGGFQFSSWDNFSTKACTASNNEVDSRACTQYLLQTYVALGVIDRIRLQLNMDFFSDQLEPDFSNTGTQRFELRNFPIKFSILGGLTFF